MYKNEESYSLNLDRINDVLECYRKVAPTCITQKGAWIKVANHPAKRFYISSKAAYQRISKYLQGERDIIDNISHKLKRDMYYDLIGVTEELMNKPEFVGKSLNYILKHAVEMPAKSFYLSVESIRIIFFNATHNKIDFKTGKTIGYGTAHK